MKPFTPIQLSYMGAMCPDCATPIPKTAIERSVCKVCGHTFWLDEESIRLTYESEMRQEMKDRK